MDRPGQARITRLITPPRAGACLVGFSGGLDSTVLLHMLASDADARSAGLRAIHVHHGLHADADAWAAHCQRVCDALGVALSIAHVDVDRASGLGLEGAARDARHRAFAQALADDEILALAHHRDDQAETFLLRALRGSGVDGLAAMRPWRAHANGWLWRPLLDLPREALLTYAREHELRWLEDPANADLHFDRNFLRDQIFPLLRQRWPHASASLACSATLSAQASELLEAEDCSALQRAMVDDSALDIDALRLMPIERRARVLRRWIAGLGLPALPGHAIERIETLLLADGDGDAGACFEWAGARIERWRTVLHAQRIRQPLPLAWMEDWNGATALALPTGDTLSLLGAAGFDQPVRVPARQGGERIVLPHRGHSHALKHVLQDQGMPPWHRERLPLVSTTDGELLAAGDAILSASLAEWLAARGARLHWARLA